MCLPNILFPVFIFAFIFHCRSFSSCWLLAFLIFSPPLWISMFNSSPLFSITRSCSFNVIHVSVNIKNNSEKDTTLLLFFLFKVRAAMCFPSKENLELHLGRYTWCLSYFTLVYLWCGRTVARSLARYTVPWLPNFLGWVDYHIFLAMGLHPRAALRARRTWSSAINIYWRDLWIW